MRFPHKSDRISFRYNEMLFERKIYSQLLDWKTHCAGKTALLIEGARRIGKSTIVEAFAKQQYESYLLLDFTTVNSRIKQYFEEYLSKPDLFYRLLQVETGVELKRRKSLLIF